MRRCGRKEQQVRPIGHADVADSCLLRRIEEVGHNATPAERSEGRLADELARGIRHHHLDLGATAPQDAAKLCRLVGGNTAGHSE
jgi:hypothetical protein